ncbi:CMRF35-like molecule 5 [Alosa sapidissima]|uniref:CMRF35-like molecule 5 n=1 Tax=Alosa sapidissima TaxID=34773 RepID=UPI001C0A6425|nr:CMRF35-like molecule 5 [Alosa sapidissima]
METPLILFCLLAVCVGVHPLESVIQMSGYVGRSAVIRCPYDRGYVGYSKYLCRGKCIWGSKDIPVRTEAGQTKAINGRFSLHDDTTAGVFTVTITGLSAGDSGQYWCGVTTGAGRYDVFTEVKLNVKKGPPPTPNPARVSSTEHQTVSSSPSFSPPPSNTSQSGHVEKTTISVQPTAASEHQMDPEDSVVMVILCILVLLVVVTVCGLVSALYYRQRRRKQTAACGPSSLMHTSDHVEEPNDYQMSEELGSIPVTRATVSSLYCHASAPPRPSVTSLCSTVKPATQGSDQPIYCNSQEDNIIYSNFV